MWALREGRRARSRAFRGGGAGVFQLPFGSLNPLIHPHPPGFFRVPAPPPMSRHPSPRALASPNSLPPQPRPPQVPPAPASSRPLSSVFPAGRTALRLAKASGSPRPSPTPAARPGTRRPARPQTTARNSPPQACPLLAAGAGPRPPASLVPIAYLPGAGGQAGWVARRLTRGRA